MAIWSALQSAVNRKSVIDRKETIENTQSMATRGEGNKARQASSIGLLIRQKEPKVLETPVDRVDSFRLRRSCSTYAVTPRRHN
jgi:hypothetical protein